MVHPLSGRTVSAATWLHYLLVFCLGLHPPSVGALVRAGLPDSTDLMEKLHHRYPKRLVSLEVVNLVELPTKITITGGTVWCEVIYV